MRLSRTLGCSVALLALLALVPGARADEHDRLTYLTFSGPVQLPGVTLVAGTYTFKLADTDGNRHIVQVFKKESSKLITTLMTIPNQRLEPVKDTYIMFAERPVGSPQAMKAWFYPGRSIGEEFIYPKRQALAIAKANHESVLSSEGEVRDTTTKVGRVNERGSFDQDAAGEAAEAAAATSARAVTTAPAATAVKQREESPVGTAGQVAARDDDRGVRRSRRTRLPQTAGPLALLELLSGLSVAGGLGLRQLRKHV
jgi:hypothetical protein